MHRVPGDERTDRLQNIIRIGVEAMALLDGLKRIHGQMFTKSRLGKKALNGVSQGFGIFGGHSSPFTPDWI